MVAKQAGENHRNEGGLTLPIPIPDEERKINLNFHFHTSFLCVKMFYEGL